MSSSGSRGKEVLAIKVGERQNGPPFIKPAMFVDGASGEGMLFSIGARLTFLDIGGPASEWRSDALIGNQSLISSEYYYRIKGGKWFLAPRGSFSKRQVPFYDKEGNRTSEYDRSDYAGSADLGYAFGRFQEFRVGYEIGHLDMNLDTGRAGLYDLSGQYRATRAVLRRDTRNGPLVPTRGTFMELRASWFDKYPDIHRDFATFEGTVQHAHSFNRHYSMNVNLAAGNSVRETALSNMFDLGGYNRMSALARSQMQGNNYYLGSFFLRRALSVDSISMFAKFYAVVGYEAGRAWYPGSTTAKPRQDGVIGFQGATRVGLVFFGASIGDQGAMKILFRVGRMF